MTVTKSAIPNWVIIGTGACFFLLFFIALIIGDQQGANTAAIVGVVLTLILYCRRLEQLLEHERAEHEDTKRKLYHALGLTSDGKDF